MTVNNKAGQPIVDPDEILRQWKQYGQKLFTTNKRPPNSTSVDDFELESLLLIYEVEHAVKSLKAGKSPVLDNVPAEFIKNCGENELLPYTAYVVVFGRHASGQMTENRKSL